MNSFQTASTHAHTHTPLSIRRLNTDPTQRYCLELLGPTLWSLTLYFSDSLSRQEEIYGGCRNFNCLTVKMCSMEPLGLQRYQGMTQGSGPTKTSISISPAAPCASQSRGDAPALCTQAPRIPEAPCTPADSASVIPSYPMYSRETHSRSIPSGTLLISFPEVPHHARRCHEPRHPPQCTLDHTNPDPTVPLPRKMQ